VSHLPRAGDRSLAIFARSGFSERLRNLAAAQTPSRPLLVDLPALYAV
jgi:hypothetical protein